jgi:hypothetical protein
MAMKARSLLAREEAEHKTSHQKKKKQTKCQSKISRFGQAAIKEITCSFVFFA